MSLPQGRRATPEAGSRKTTALAAAAAAGFGLIGTARSFVAGTGRSGGISSSASVTAKGAEAATTSLRGPSAQPSSPEGPRLAYAAATAVGVVACAAGARRRGRAGVTPSSSAFTSPASSSPGLVAGTGATDQVQHGSSTTCGAHEWKRVNALTAKMWVNKENKRYVAPGRKFTTGQYRTGPWRRERRWEMWLKYSQKYSGRRRNCFRIAKEAVMKALKAKYRSRRQLKRSMRKIWIMRLNANARLHGTNYNRLIHRLKLNNVDLNRKILSQLAVYDRPVFTSVMNVVSSNWPEKLAEKRGGQQKTYTPEQIDEVAIPWMERQFPAIYTDTNVRFNRQTHDHGAVEYTVDFGDPKMWREYLPQTPELANFNIPDHWVKDANRGQEPWKLDYMNFPGEKNDNKDYIFAAPEYKANQLQEQEKQENGEENRLTKEGSRDDWFKEEQQSWFDN